jgi:hypothetical protein
VEDDVDMLLETPEVDRAVLLRDDVEPVDGVVV